MSFPSPCPGCREGDHEEHDPNHGIIPGVIGGTVCVCSGDCADRPNAVEFLLSGLKT